MVKNNDSIVLVEGYSLFKDSYIEQLEKQAMTLYNVTRFLGMDIKVKC